MKTAFNLCLYFCLALNCFAAGWDTNAWSGNFHRYYLDASTNKVFIKEALSSDAFAAIEERADISGVAAATTNSWFRNNRADLVNIKAWIVSNADEFIDVDAVTTNGWTTLETNTISYAIFQCSSPRTTNDQDEVGFIFGWPTWSPSKIISELGLVSNYFTSTPWRSLTSTNAANGWHPIDDILNLLVSLPSTVTWTSNGEDNRYDGGSFGGSQGFVKGSAINNGETNSVNPAISISPYALSWLVWEGGSGICEVYGAVFETVYSYPVFTLTTNYSADVTLWVYVDEKDTLMHNQAPGTNHLGIVKERGHPLDTGYYSQESSNFPTNGHFAVSTNLNVSGVYTDYVLGDLTRASWPAETGSSDPFMDDISSQPLLGWRYTSSGWIVRDSLIVADYTSSTNSITYYAD